MVSLEKVSKAYRLGGQTVEALREIELDIGDGEFLSVVGPSGSGKSTLLHVIGGLDRPTRGRVLVEGRDLAQAGDRELAAYRNRYVGFVFQTFNLHPIYTALENVALPLVFAGVPRADRLERARQELEAVGLASRARHRPGELSGGERQRVAIARALVAGPRIILADEPTGNLDSQSGELIVETLLRLNRERSITLVIVTHDPDLAARAPRGLRLRDGIVVEERGAAA